MIQNGIIGENKEMRGKYNEKVVIMYRNGSFDGKFSRV